MKKLMYGALFLAAVGIGVVGCRKENLQTNVKQSAKEVSADGKMLIFETVEIYENAIENQSDEERKAFLKKISKLNFKNYFSVSQHNIKSENDSMQEMDEFIGQLLNEDGIIQIGNFIYKVNLQAQKVFTLPVTNASEYQDLVNENKGNKNIREFSTDDDVIYLAESGETGQKCGGSAEFFRESDKYYDGGLEFEESVKFEARYLKLGIYFSVRIKGYHLPNDQGIYFTWPTLNFEVKSDVTNSKAMRMRPRPCSGDNNVYHHGGMRSFTGGGVWSSDAFGRYQVFKAYERTRGLNGYRVWVRGYCNGNLAHTDWIGREVNSNF